MSKHPKLIRTLIATIASALVAMSLAQDPQYAGLDKDLSGITIRMANIGGGQYEAMYGSIPEFEKATGAKVEIVALLDGFAIDQKLKVDFATNAVDYDVAWDHTSFMAQYINYLQPLETYFSKDDLAEFSPAIIDSATVDGHLYLIPRHADIGALLYRTDLFEDPAIQAAYQAEFGEALEPPTDLATIDKQAHFFVKNGYAKQGWGMAGKEEALTGRFYELLFSSGGSLFDASWHPTFNDAIGVQVATMLRDWYASGIIAQDTPSLLWDGDAQAFCNGDVATKIEWYGWYSYFQDPSSCPAVAGKFGWMRGPLGFDNPGQRHTGWAGAHAFSITKASKNPEAAAQLIKFLTSERVAYEEAKLGFLPVRNDVWDRVIADADKSDVALDKVRLETARVQVSEDFRTPPLIAEWIPFSNIFYPKLQAIMLGDVTPQAGLDAAAEATRKLMSDAGYY